MDKSQPSEITCVKRRWIKDFCVDETTLTVKGNTLKEARDHFDALYKKMFGDTHDKKE